MKFYTIFFICAFVPLAWANSAGAPKEACSDLTPQHGVSTQSSPAPYSIALSNDAIKSGEPVKITIRGNSGNDLIKGFLAQARIGSEPVGTFTPGPNSQTLDCKGSKDSITHTKMPGNGVNEVTFSWNPPSDLKGDITFSATVVQEAEVFWVGKLTKSATIV